MLSKITSLCLAMFCALQLFAGNPDRQGEAGAYELLMNPWARSAGFHTLNTSMISGVEAMRLNVAGLSRISSTQINVGFAQYLQGTGVNLSAVGLAQKIGNGAFGLSIMTVGFGDIDITTTANPAGTGATYSPSFFNMGVSYAHMFENKIAVGITARIVTESVSNVAATAACFDAGVQYISGAKDNLKLGISLRNVGTKMSFRGDGLSFRTPSPDVTESNTLTVQHRAQGFELPSVLNIGLSYDIYLDGEDKFRLTPFGNFTANSFSQDDLGGGLELSLFKMVAFRAAYRYSIGDVEELESSAYSGLAFGASFQLPIKKGTTQNISFDYGFRASDVFEGTHNFGLVLSL